LHISGVGAEKRCLLDNTIDARGRSFRDRMREYDYVIHPWTSRPEAEYISPGFTDIYDETKYLFCEVGVEGIFTEDVAATILVAQRGCNDNSKDNHNNDAATSTTIHENPPPVNCPEVASPSPPTSSLSSSTSLNNSNEGSSSNSNNNTNIGVVVASFIAGIAATMIGTYLFTNKFTRRRRYADGMRVVPSNAPYDPRYTYDLEMT
jgi:hypothetical protein